MVVIGVFVFQQYEKHLRHRSLLVNPDWALSDAS
jgi:hypothetical protein